MLKWHNDADLFIPGDASPEDSIQKITHLAIGAHPDDLEIMAFHGILFCLENPDYHFGGITCTNGSGCPRSGPYAFTDDEAMVQIRKNEQKAAATVGSYQAMLQLGYPSVDLMKDRMDELIADLHNFLTLAKPTVIYTHNPADKHLTHIAIVSAVIKAVHLMPEAERPDKLFGCEAWRGLDWMRDQDKRVFDVSDKENLALALIGVHDSQISGGKRYDLAARGRRRANATFHQSHHADKGAMLDFAMDLSPLIRNEKIKLSNFTLDYIRNFSEEVRQALETFER